MTNKEKIMLDGVELEKVYSFKLKPVYNFQSVEIEFIGSKEEFLNDGLEMYEEILRGLQVVTDSVIEPPKNQNAKANVPKVPLATTRQREIMDRYDIKYSKNTTQEEARKLITESIERSKEMF